ncbi:MAG: dihydrofolate reductase [Bacteroidaceae bacterium]|nr:dihydrofolate reductase [Bacteroidaceae bacterium]
MKEKLMVTVKRSLLSRPGALSSEDKADNAPFKYVAEQFADLQLLRYQVPGFEQLSLQQKKLIYNLSQAALEGRDIIYDQNGRYNLVIRRLLEAVYIHFKGDRTTENFKNLEIYLKRVWFSNGIHHHYATDKFVPGFTPDFLAQQLHAIDAALLPLERGQTVDAFCAEILPVLFDPTLFAKRVNQANGEDVILTSACNYYAGVTQQEAEDFYAAMKNPTDASPVMYGMNSRLVKEDGKLVEYKWVADGLYGKAIQRILFWLQKAKENVENDSQKEVIDQLILFYQTGDLSVFDAYSIAWVKDVHSRVDFVNGFIESYGDPLGLKSSWESIVNFKDIEATKRTELISSNAQWFEQNSPVAAPFKKEKVKGVTAKVITAAILSGDLSPATAIGINLPNSNWIRAEYGSKSVSIGNLTNAYHEAGKGDGFLEEFVYSDVERHLIKQYGAIVDNLHTDLHECLGHGSGKLLPGVDPDALKTYGATIEEARADLFGLYYLPDARLVELGLTPTADAYKAEYYTFMMNGLMTQLTRIKIGQQIEESHMRDRQLIARWVFTKGAADQVVELKKREGKSYVVINDYQKLRTLFGEFLAEIQRVKSEGDLDTARQLVEHYAIAVNPVLHQEVVERYEQLHLVPYKGFINPVYTPVKNEKGEIVDVTISYAETYSEQMLRYSRDYSNLPSRN